MHTTSTAGSEAGLIAGRNGYGIAAYAKDSQNSFTGFHGHFIPTAGLSSEDDWIVGFAFYANTNYPTQNSRAPVLQFVDSDSYVMMTLYLSSGTLSAFRGSNFSTGVKLGFADALMPTKVWHYIECKINFATAATGSIVVHVDEEPVMNLTSVKTSNTDLRPSMVCVGGGTAGNDFWVDDIYICDDQGSVNNDFLGDVRIERLSPSGAGTTTGFTPSAGANWDAVDDIVSSEVVRDGDTTYVESKVAGIKDTYLFTNSATTTPAEIVAVSVKSNVRKTDAGSRTFVHVAKAPEGDEDDSAALYPSVTYRYMESVFETDPNSGVAWLIADVNTAEFGYKVAT